jgi:hypothetical protein
MMGRKYRNGRDGVPYIGPSRPKKFLTPEQYQEQFGKEMPPELLATIRLHQKGEGPPPVDTTRPPSRAKRYQQYMASPEWSERKKRYKKENGIEVCEGCGKKPRKPIHIHHASYDEAFEGREPDDHLFALCERCHHKVHNLARKYGLWGATSLVVKHGKSAWVNLIG